MSIRRSFESSLSSGACLRVAHTREQHGTRATHTAAQPLLVAFPGPHALATEIRAIWAAGPTGIARSGRKNQVKTHLTV